MFAQLVLRLVAFLEPAFLHLTQPSCHSIVLSTVIDVTRSQADLVIENGLLRRQLIVLHRQVKKPSFSQSGRLLFVLLASRVKNWKDALLILKPAPPLASPGFSLVLEIQITPVLAVYSIQVTQLRQ